MTETTKAPGVYLKYDHPAGLYGRASGCEVQGWYVSANSEDQSVPEEPLDSNCLLCAAPGRFDRKVYISKQAGPMGCSVLPKGVEPGDILPGMPLLSTDRGYKPTG